MHDPVEIRQRIDRLVRRVGRRDDYGTLLACGEVVRRVDEIEDADAWRAEIKRQARADKIKVRSGANAHVVYAFLAHAVAVDRDDDERRYTRLLERIVPLAVAGRHEPFVGLRDGDEVICRCERCPAQGYASAADGVVGGSLFEDDCPRAEAPALTSLAFMYCGRMGWEGGGA